MSDIYVIAMPFGSVEWPSLGMSQLVAAAKQDGLDAKATYPCLKFAEQIGYNLYKIIADLLRSDQLYGEWLFAQAAFEDFEMPRYKLFLDTFVKSAPLLKYINTTFGKDEDFFVSAFKKISEQAKVFTVQTAQEILTKQPRIIGCSATFMQYSASLALLRKIKHLDPTVVTMLGGANCEAEMGWVTIKNFEWIDFVVSGEADMLFPYVCRQIFKYGTDIPVEVLPYGVYSRCKLVEAQQTAKRVEPETAIEPDLNAIPFPDYHDYFQDLHQTEMKQQLTSVLSMETSRGCWKGWRQPCNFCGLNGKRVHYRVKSPKRVLQELQHLSSTYGINMFVMTDTILHMGYFKDLFKKLSQQQAPYKFFFETSSTLTEDHVKLLADAGVVKIQPGIESLHDELLTLLNKGNSAIQNIALLKFALENGIAAYWNLLFNIPGDRDNYYQEMAELLPLLYHLQPPNLVPIRFDRFSEYFEKSELFGLNLAPSQFYQYVYPFKADDLEIFACFFEDTVVRDNGKHPCKPGVNRLHTLVYKEWRNAFYHLVENDPKAELVLSEREHQTVISDTRPCAVASEFSLTGVEHLIYKACRKPVKKSFLYQLVYRGHQGIPIDEQVVDQNIQQLLEKKLLLHINGKYLALATLKPRREFAISPGHADLFFARFMQKQTTETIALQNKTWKWFASLEIS